MKGDSCEQVLGIEFLLGEIMKRIGCTQSFLRSSTVNKFWLSTAQHAGVVDGFSRRNKPSFLGFIAELQRGFGREIELLFPSGDSTSDSARAMLDSFDANALNGSYIVASHGGRLICQTDEFHGGFNINCPYSKPTLHTFVGPPIPQIPKNTGHHTANTYGQFGVLYRTGGPGSTSVGFFVKDAAGFFDRLYEGIRFKSDSSVFVHVCVFRNERWVRYISDPLIPPPLATFHRNPYCVQARSLFYMMYLVGFIVYFDLEQSSFGVVRLPGEMSTTVKSWFEYTIGPHPEGDLAVVHLDHGKLVKWVLVREPGSTDWYLEGSVDLAEAFGDMVSNSIPMALPSWTIKLALNPSAIYIAGCTVRVYLCRSEGGVICCGHAAKEGSTGAKCGTACWGVYSPCPRIGRLDHDPTASLCNLVYNIC